MDDEPAVLHEGGGEFHAEAAKEEEVAGGVAEADWPGEEGEAVVEEDGDVLLFLKWRGGEEREGVRIQRRG